MSSHRVNVESKWSWGMWGWGGLWVVLGFPQVARQLFGNFSYFEQLFPLSATFFPFEQLLAFCAISRPMVSEDCPSVVRRLYERFRRLTKFVVEDFVEHPKMF